jgi:hypothetical protein
MAATATVRVDAEVCDRINELAAARGVKASQPLEQLVRAAEEDQRLADMNADFDALGQDPKARGVRRGALGVGRDAARWSRRGAVSGGVQPGGRGERRPDVEVVERRHLAPVIGGRADRGMKGSAGRRRTRDQASTTALRGRSPTGQGQPWERNRGRFDRG